MSFGWSAGDIVAALQLLNNVIVALKDTGGASQDYQDASSFLNILSVTLQHLQALQYTPLDPHLAQNLKQLCEQIRRPSEQFCEQIESSFKRDLGESSARLRILTTGRKIQWALSTSKKVKDLREKIGGPIAAIGIILSQQIIQTTLQMPFEIQARIAHTIDAAVDTRISPLTLAVKKEVKDLSEAHETSSIVIEERIKDSRRDISLEIKQRSQEITVDLQRKFDALSFSQMAHSGDFIETGDKLQRTFEVVRSSSEKTWKASLDIQGMIAGVSTRQKTSTDLILRKFQETNQKTTDAIRTQTSASREQTFSLHQKLDKMNLLIGTVKDSIADLSAAEQYAVIKGSNSEIQKAFENIRKSVWLLVSALLVLIQELIYLLTPYLAILYRSSIEPLLLCGDHFLFEDAIGRRKWLPCIQFQHWDNFYKFLVNTFQGEFGLSRVLNGQFMILNGYNEVPIHKKAWRAVIQPKSRVSMAMMLENASVKIGKCPSPSCSGQVDFSGGEVSRICPKCGKHLYTLKYAPSDIEENNSDTTFNFDFEASVHLPREKLQGHKETYSKPRHRVTSTSFKNLSPSNATDKDIAAFKRVIWQTLNESRYYEYPTPTPPVTFAPVLPIPQINSQIKSNPMARKAPLTPRGPSARLKHPLPQNFYNPVPLSQIIVQSPPPEIQTNHNPRLNQNDMSINHPDPGVLFPKLKEYRVKHVCHICSMEFPRAHDLRRHLRNHINNYVEDFYDSRRACARKEQVTALEVAQPRL